MKKITLSLALLVITMNLISQESIPQNQTKDTYLKKSKSQNHMGWVLLLGGTTIMVAGASQFEKSWDSGSATSTDIYGYMILGGLLADFASIPFFISAGKNKRVAAKLSVNYQNTFIMKSYSQCLTFC